MKSFLHSHILAAALAVFFLSVLSAQAQQRSLNTDIFTNAAVEPGVQLPSLSAQGNIDGTFDVTPKPQSSMTPQEQAQFGAFAQKTTPKPRCGPQSNGYYIMCEPIPFVNPVQKDPAAFLRQLYILAFILAGSVAFIQIVRGGVLYSISGIVDGKNRAKTIFKGVAQGLALLMGSYVILNTINPALVTLKFPDADNYFPPVPARAETIYQEMDQMRTNFENDGRLITRETESQVADLDYRRANLSDTQAEVDRLTAVPNRTNDEETELRFAQENLARDKRALQVTEEEVLLLETADPNQLVSQQISREERTLLFMNINLQDTKDTIAELSTLSTRTESQQRELDTSIELLPKYQSEFDIAQNKLSALKNKNVP